MKHHLSQSFLLKDFINHIEWSADGRYLALSLSQGEVAVSLISSRFAAHQLGCLQVAWLDAQTLATAGQDGKLKVWNWAQKQLIWEQKGGASWVEQLAYNPTSQLLASSAGKILRIWDKEGTLIHSFDTHKSTISALQWSTDGQELAVVYYGGATIRNFVSGQEQELAYKISLIAMAWSPNKKYLAAGTQDNRVHFWMLPYEPESDLAMSGYPFKVKSLSWTQDSRYLATPTQDAVVVWDVGRTGSPRGTAPATLQFAHSGRVLEVSYQKDGVFLASADENGAVAIWDYPLSEEVVLDFTLSTKGITQLRWAKGEDKLAISTEEGIVRILFMDTHINKQFRKK
jgi:WD40 repeat protein